MIDSNIQFYPEWKKTAHPVSKWTCGWSPQSRSKAHEAVQVFPSTWTTQKIFQVQEHQISNWGQDVIFRNIWSRKLHKCEPFMCFRERKKWQDGRLQRGRRVREIIKWKTQDSRTQSTRRKKSCLAFISLNLQVHSAVASTQNLASSGSPWYTHTNTHTELFNHEHANEERCDGKSKLNCFLLFFPNREDLTQVICIIVSFRRCRTRIQTTRKMSHLTFCLLTMGTMIPFAPCPSGNKSVLNQLQNLTVTLHNVSLFP